MENLYANFVEALKSISVWASTYQQQVTISAEVTNWIYENCQDRPNSSFEPYWYPVRGKALASSRGVHDRLIEAISHLPNKQQLALMNNGQLAHHRSHTTSKHAAVSANSSSGNSQRNGGSAGGGSSGGGSGGDDGGGDPDGDPERWFYLLLMLLWIINSSQLYRPVPQPLPSPETQKQARRARLKKRAVFLMLLVICLLSFTACLQEFSITAVATFMAALVALMTQA